MGGAWSGRRRDAAALVLLAAGLGAPLSAGEIGRGEVYSVVEVEFRGPHQGAANAPARDVELTVRFRHESGGEEHPSTASGTATAAAAPAATSSRSASARRPRPLDARRGPLRRRAELDDQRRASTSSPSPPSRHGFWIVDDDSPGRRWYRRSDGSHQYIIGNTHYSFLSGYRARRRAQRQRHRRRHARATPSTSRSCVSACIGRPLSRTRPIKPFLDDSGRPTDDGDFSHRPNPAWFHDRADVAVAAACERDLIADLILCGPDTRGRPARRCAPTANGGDPTP